MTEFDEDTIKEAEERMIISNSSDGKIPIDRLIEGMKQKYNFFTDQVTSERFIIRPDGVCEPFGDNVNRYIAMFHYRLTGKKTADIDFTRTILEAECVNNTQNTHLRRAAVVEDNNRVLYYRLSPQEYIRVDASGWNTVSSPESKIWFRDSNLNAKQVSPTKGDKSLYELLSYLPLNDNQRILMMGVLVSSFIEDIDHPLVNINGDQGSGKTEVACHLATVIDPGFNGIGDLAIEPPKESDKMGLQLAGQAAIVYDNIVNFSQSQSDTIAVAATGGSLIIRDLYTTKNMIRLVLKLTVFLTGITSALYNPDVLDRAMNFPLTRIEEYVSKRKFREYGNEAIPHILYEIFDILSITIREKNEYINPTNHRLSDFITVMYLAGRYCGIEDEKILSAIEENDLIGNNTILDSSPLAGLIRMVVLPGQTKEISSSEMYDLACAHHIDTYKSPASIGKAFNKIKINLGNEGFLISNRDSNTKKYTIMKPRED